MKKILLLHLKLLNSELSAYRLVISKELRKLCLKEKKL